MGRGRPLWILLILSASLAGAGCFTTGVEVVRAQDGVRLLGAEAEWKDKDGVLRTSRWDARRGGYVGGDPDVSLTRFARLRDDVYLMQSEMNLSDDRRAAPPGQRGYILNFATIENGQLKGRQYDCGDRDLSQAAIDYGIVPETSDLIGSRAAILGYLSAMLSCPIEDDGSDPNPDGLRAQPGGIPLANQGVRPSPANVVESLQGACSRGWIRHCRRLAQMLVSGTNGKSDLRRASRILETACAAHDPSSPAACVDLAVLLDRNAALARAPGRVQALLEGSCAAREPYACELLRTRRR